MPLLTVAGVTRPVRAVVFDKDGTLMDFGLFWREVATRRIANVLRAVRGMDAVFDEAGLRASLLATTGLAADGAIDPFGPLATGSRQEEIVLAAGTLYREAGVPFAQARELCRQAFGDLDEAALLVTHTRPLPGVPEVLRRMQQAGLLLAIASTDSTANIERGVALLGIGNEIAACIGADRVDRGKPQPDMLVLAAERLGVPVAEIVMVGDGVVDMQMGRNAGVAFTVGVETGLARAEQLAPYADVVLPDLTAWDLDLSGPAGAGTP